MRPLDRFVDVGRVPESTGERLMNHQAPGITTALLRYAHGKTVLKELSRDAFDFMLDLVQQWFRTEINRSCDLVDGNAPVEPVRATVSRPVAAGPPGYWALVVCG